MPDHMPILLEIRDKLNRPRPTGIKRTKDGMKLVFDEAPPPERWNSHEQIRHLRSRYSQLIFNATAIANLADNARPRVTNI